MRYRNYHILLFRPKTIENLLPTEAKRDTGLVRQLTLYYEWLKTSCLLGLLIPRKSTRTSQILNNLRTVANLISVPAPFGALSIHTIVICRCREDPIRRQLDEKKSWQRMLAKSWPDRICILNVFVDLMRLMRHGPGWGLIVNASSSIASLSEYSGLCTDTLDALLMS